MLKSLLIAGAAVAVLAGCAKEPPPPGPRQTPMVPDPTPEQYRQAQVIIREVNKFRAQNGLPPLVLETHLIKAAIVKARDFHNNWKFVHAGSDGSRPEQRVSRTGYRWTQVAETLAAGSPTPAGAVATLAASPCHRWALLRPSYLQAGAAYVYTPNAPPGRYKYWWVVKMARPDSSMHYDKTFPTAGTELKVRPGPPTKMALPHGCVIRGGPSKNQAKN
jgi:uncharacterized protein YkwD